MTQTPTQKKLGVYCGSSTGTKPAYATLARELGQEMVKRDYGLVYGGGNIGLMGEIARAVIAAGGSVTGVIPEFLKVAEVGLAEGADLQVVPDMHTRKNTMMTLSHAFIAMPGGFGTYEEIFEALTWSQLGLHNKPCAFLNTDGFYDSLIQFINHSIEQGFIHSANRGLFVIADNPKDLLDKIEAFQHPNIDKIALAKDNK